jgi:hypothetical protein
LLIFDLKSKQMHFLIINGPNLNLLGTREPEIYGNLSFEDYLKELQNVFDSHQLSYFQSNDEGAIINQIQAAGQGIDGILLNAAGYTHTSVAIADAVAGISTPCSFLRKSTAGGSAEDRKSAGRVRAAPYTSSAEEIPESSLGAARRPRRTQGRCEGHSVPASLDLKAAFSWP